MLPKGMCVGSGCSLLKSQKTGQVDFVDTASREIDEVSAGIDAIVNTARDSAGSAENLSRQSVALRQAFSRFRLRN